MKVHGLALSAIAIRAFSVLSGALITIAIARLAGPESVGIYALIVMFATFSAVPIKGAVAAILFRELARARDEREFDQAVRLLKFAYRCLLYTLPLAGLFSAFLIVRLDVPRETWWTVVPLLLAIMTFEGWAAIQISALRGADRSLFAQSLDGALRPLGILIGIVLALTFLDPTTPIANLCIGYLAGLIATRFAGAIALGRVIRSIAVPALSVGEFFAKFKRQALVFFGSSFTATAIANFDIAIGSLLLTVEEIGFYKIVLQLCLIANALYVGLNFHVARDFAAYSKPGSGDSARSSEVESRARHFSRLCVAFAVAVTVFLCFAGNLIMTYVFDVDPNTSWLIFAIVGGSFIVNSAVGMGNSFLMMNHDENFVLLWSVLAVILALPFSFAWIELFDVYGAGAALLSVTVIWNFGLAWRCHRKFAFNPTILNFRERR